MSRVGTFKRALAVFMILDLDELTSLNLHGRLACIQHQNQLHVFTGDLICSGTKRTANLGKINLTPPSSFYSSSLSKHNVEMSSGSYVQVVVAEK